MQEKGNPNRDHVGSPLDTWKSSDTQTKKSGTGAESAHYGTAYQEQVSTFESEGNIQHSAKPTQSIKSIKNFGQYADRGLKEARRAAHVSSLWIKENPALAVGVGLCLGFLLGHQIKARIGAGDGTRIL